MANASGQNKDLKNQIANRSNAGADEFQAVITEGLSKSFKAMKSIVPKHVTPERLARVCLNAISRNPKLMQCTPESIIGSIMNCASLGLEPNLLGHAYIVPFYNGQTRKMEAQFQVGYKGIIELFRRTGEVSSITAHEVYENDTFEAAYGTEEKIVHKPAPFATDRGQVVGYYSTYRLKDSSFGFCIMSKKEIEEHRDKYTKSRNKAGKITGPWADPDQFHEMAKKTCILKMAKYMPISIEKQENQTILEGINRDSAVIKVKEDNIGFGDSFMDAEYSINTDVDEPTDSPEQDNSKTDNTGGEDTPGNPNATLDFEQSMNGQAGA